MALIDRCYAINRSSNSIYYSDDFGLTWTEVPITASTTSASDIGANPYIFENIGLLNGSGTPTTPYFSVDSGASFSTGANISGKEILYITGDYVVSGGKRLNATAGPKIHISADGGATFTETLDLTSLFAYPGASFSNITVMSVDFNSEAGGYIAVSGNADNLNSDQIITRTYNRGASFPDSIILDGNIYGVIRCLISNDAGRVIFAAGDPGSVNRGKIYTIDQALSDVPIEVFSGITAGDPTNATITKFFTPNTGLIREIFYFIDSDGDLYKSTTGGETWQFLSTIPGNCVDILAFDATKLIALTSSPNAIQKSDDGGLTWTEIPQPSWNNPVALAYNTKNACRTCNPGFQLGYISVNSNSQERCIGSFKTGPICKPPYEYFTIDKVCATPSNVRPTNLVYSVDQSGSIDASENILFKAFINKVTESLADRLAIGSIEIAVVAWSTATCINTDFTSDINVINNAVLSNSFGSCAGGNLTNHIAAFCTSTRLLHEKSLQRPDAENIMIIFTDGSNNYTDSCNLSDIGLGPSVVNTSSDMELLKLAADAKQNLAGKGMKIFVVAVGSIADIANLRSTFIDDALLLGVEPYPSISTLGNYYFFSGGDFSTIDSISNQIRLGLGASIYTPDPCPENCEGIAGADGLGYCECLIADVAPLCIYKLEDCQNPPIQPTIYTKEDDLKFYILPDSASSGYGSIVTLKNPPSPGYFYQPGCYQVSVVGEAEAPLIPEADIKAVEVFTHFVTCESCLSPELYKFTDCTNPNRFIYTTDNCANRIQTYGNVWKTTKQPYDDGTCWRGEYVGVVPNASPIVAGWQSATPITPGPLGGIYQSCEACLPVDIPTYKCTDCENNLPPVYTDRDFSFAVGQVLKVLQYPDVCWNVSLNTDTNFTLEVLTPDGLPYPICQDCLPVAAVTYTLTDCNDATNTIATQSNLDQYLTNVVRLTTTGDTCWIISAGSSPGLVPQPVSVSQSFADCPECNPQIYRFIDCQNPTNIIYTLVDFSAYVGQTVNLQEYPGVCWVVSTTDDTTVLRQDVTIEGEPFADCPSCVITYYQLTNCANQDVFLISTSTQLSQYLNRTITAAGYPGLCFTVTSPKCNCIRATINGVEYDAYPESSQFNGRNVYYITTDSGDELAIAWSINPNRWELFDRNTNDVYGFNVTDTDCPFSNFWTITQASPYIITTVSFCADRIYNIAPELDFADCVPCINCI